MVTIVIPFLNSCPERLANLTAVLEVIEFLKIPCIVVEQVPESETDKSELAVSDSILYLYHRHDGDLQKKAQNPRWRRSYTSRRPAERSSAM